MQGLFLGSRPGSGFAGSLQRVYPFSACLWGSLGRWVCCWLLLGPTEICGTAEVGVMAEVIILSPLSPIETTEFSGDVFFLLCSDVDCLTENTSS